MRTRFIDLRISTGENSTEAAEIVVVDGRIEEILPPATATASGDEQWISFDDALVLPGVIDDQVHAPFNFDIPPLFTRSLRNQRHPALLQRLVRNKHDIRLSGKVPRNTRNASLANEYES